MVGEDKGCVLYNSSVATHWTFSVGKEGNDSVTLVIYRDHRTIPSSEYLHQKYGFEISTVGIKKG